MVEVFAEGALDATVPYGSCVALEELRRFEAVNASSNGSFMYLKLVVEHELLFGSCEGGACEGTRVLHVFVELAVCEVGGEFAKEIGSLREERRRRKNDIHA